MNTPICEVYCDHIASYMLHSLLFTDIFPLLIDQDSQLQLIIHSMLIRKLKTDLLRLDTYIWPRLQKNQRFFGQALIAHLNRMLQIILPNANDLRKGSPRIGLKQLLHYLSYIANPSQYEKRSNWEHFLFLLTDLHDLCLSDRKQLPYNFIQPVIEGHNGSC